MSYLDDLDEDEVAAMADIGSAYLDELCGYRKRPDAYHFQPEPYPDLEDVSEEQVKTAWDLGVSLPSGHPFAPVVDEKAAA